MNSNRWRSALVTGATLVIVSIATHATEPLPTIDGKKVVAKVNGVSITLDEFAEALARTHMGAGQGDSPAPRLDPVRLLDRLIAAELVSQEAENIGLDELPVVAEGIAAYRIQAQREILFGRHARKVTVPDAERVEALYRSTVGEVKLESLVFESQELATQTRARLDADETFDQLAAAAESDPQEIGHETYDFVRPSELFEGIRDALALIQPGQVSSVVPAGDKFAIVKFVDVRYPEERAKREEAEKTVLRLQRQHVLREYTVQLTEQYTTIDEEFLRGLDYSPEGPGLEAMRANERTVAAVRGGGDPIRVGELTRALEKKSFHGAERAMEQGKLDERKHRVLTNLCKKRALAAEIEVQKIEQSDEFAKMMQDFRQGRLFDIFVERVIDPSIKLDQQQVKKYLAEHQDEYSTPEMVRIDSLAFVERAAAELAAEKLRKGVDFGWLAQNADGQVGTDAEADPEPLRFDGRRPIVKGALPEGLREAVDGANAGDIRVYADPQEYAYLIRVREAIPARPQEFEAIKDVVAQRVQRELRQESLDRWVGELRAASEVETFASGDNLLGALGMQAAGQN